MYAQGDVLLLPVKAVKPPMTGVKLATPDDPVILAKGETTGHRHAFYNRVAMFRDDALARAAHVPETLYIGHVVVAPGGDVLEHGAAQGLAGDHDALTIPAGTYIARRQQEYPLRESARIVND